MTVLWVGDNDAPPVQDLELKVVADWESAARAVAEMEVDCVLTDPGHSFNCPADFQAPILEWSHSTVLTPARLCRLCLRELRRDAAERSEAGGERLRLDAELAETRSRLDWALAHQSDHQALYDEAPVGQLVVDRQGRIRRANLRAAWMLGRSLKELLESPLVAMLPPQTADEVLPHLWARLRGQSDELWKLELRNEQGEVRSVQVSSAALPARPHQVQLALTDVTLADSSWNDDRQRLARLEAACEHLRQGLLLADRKGVILSLNRAGERILGRDEAEVRGLGFARLGLVVRLGVSTPQVVFCGRREGRGCWAEFRVSTFRLQNHLHYLIQFQDLNELRRAQRELQEIRETERRAVGQELHDDLGQDLTALAFVAQILHSKLTDAPPELLALSQQVAQQSRQAIQKTRALARGLYPAVLEREGLARALRELAAFTEETFGLRCTVVSAELGLPPAVELHLYRFAQEALNNAVKHSRARNLSLRLEGDEGSVTITVSDDGRGLPQRPKGGLGMRSMRHHAELLEGEFEVDSQPGKGTLVKLWAPLPPAGIG